jgi:hypothetical protein
MASVPSFGHISVTGAVKSAALAVVTIGPAVFGMDAPRNELVALVPAQSRVINGL